MTLRPLFQSYFVHTSFFENIFSIYSETHKIRNHEYVLRKIMAEEKKGLDIDAETFEKIASNFTDIQLAKMIKDTENSTSDHPHDKWWGENINQG